MIRVFIREKKLIKEKKKGLIKGTIKYKNKNLKIYITNNIEKNINKKEKINHIVIGKKLLIIFIEKIHKHPYKEKILNINIIKEIIEQKKIYTINVVYKNFRKSEIFKKNKKTIYEVTKNLKLKCRNTKEVPKNIVINMKNIKKNKILLIRDIKIKKAKIVKLNKIIDNPLFKL